MTHTPGPWEVLEPLGRPLEIRTADEDWRLICTLADYRESDGDARLIAAAPEMLEALKALVAAVPHELKASEKFNAAWHEARAAIARAEKTP